MSMVSLVERIVAVDVSEADTNTVRAVLDWWRQVRNWGDSIEVACANRLNELATVEPSIFPERVVADVTRVSMNEAVRRFDRAKTTTAISELGTALQDGSTSGGHVDVVSAGLRGLSGEQKALLVGRGPQLAAAAASMTRDAFAREVARHIKDVCADDGISRLERQRRNTRLRSWIDRDTGMWCLKGEFDPETGARLAARLRAEVEARFHQRTPDTAPDDPLAKQQHLAALALVGLVEGNSRGKGRTELVVIVDAKTLVDGQHPDTFVDVGIDIDLPIETLRRMACSADVFVPVLSAANGINLYLGRDQRVATPEQRRLLRVMYRTCMMPGCDVAFDDCQIHHVDFYGRDFGLTNINRIGPLCHHHHHGAHEGGIKLALDEHRTLTITYPDGTVRTHPPPQRRAA
jgi:hypothetical protein